MDKVLKCDYFKKHKFPTKESGMEYISKTKDLSKFYDKQDEKIKNYMVKIMTEWENEFKKYSGELKEYLFTAKKHAIEKRDRAKESKDSRMREELKRELREELLMEASLLPRYNKDIDYNNFDKLFIGIKNTNLLKETEGHFKNLEEIYEKLKK